jgi:FkbM family methyltransferase
MLSEALRSNPNSSPVQTLIPGQTPINLVAYYLHQVDYYPECELQTKRWFVENVGSDWVMFDVGANIGYYSILFSRLAPAGKIYAFEPTETFFMLQENLAYNSCQNVKPLQIAVGVVTGPVEDNVFRIWGTGPERRIYDFSTVDELVHKLDISRLDCIKIDVDSFDFEVLMGAEETLRRFNPWIVVELCHALSERNQSVPEALEWLASKGYRKAHVLDHANFLLRRDGAPLNGEQSIHLTFENRPIFLPLPWIKDEPIASLFAFEPVLHNQGKVVFDTPNKLSIGVPGPRWAYACSWRHLAEKHIDRPYVIEIKMQVGGGAVGVGCVVDDFSQYVGKEIHVTPNADVQTVCIYVEDHAAAHHLVLRNIDPAGHEAHVTISELGCYTAAKNPSY